MANGYWFLVGGCCSYGTAAGQGKAGDINELRIWDAVQLHLLMVIENKGNMLSDIAWHPNGRVVAAAAKDQINIYERESGSLLATLELGSAEITQIGWSPDGSRIAASTVEGILWVWRWE